jgi:hypothetical protein
VVLERFGINSFILNFKHSKENLSIYTEDESGGFLLNKNMRMLGEDFLRHRDRC